MHKATQTALVASLLAGGLLLAGCGGSSSTSASTTGSASASAGAQGSSGSASSTGGSSSAKGYSSGSSGTGGAGAKSSGSSAPSAGSGASSAPKSGLSATGSVSATVSTTVSSFQKQFLSVNNSAKTVTWKLDGGSMNHSSPFAYDGVSNGKLVLTVPKGWKVKVDFKDVGNLPHSAVILKSKSSKTPAFPGATTPNAASGSPPGSTDSYTFTPQATGTYYAVCLVPGHEQAGMWAVIKVVSSGTPSLQG